jgi:O-antigen/teichoic acid export membrane protein
MSEMRRVGRHTLIYGIGVVATKLVSFVMLPVYTNFLTPADYGVLELLSTTIDIIGMIGGIGLAAGMFKHYADSDSDEARKEVISTVVLANSAISGAIAIVGILASPLLNDLVFKGEQPVIYFRLFFISYFLQGFTNIGFAFVQIQERSKLFVGMSVAKLAVTLGLSIWFVAFLQLGVWGVLLAGLIGSGLTAAALALYLFPRVGVRFSYPRFRSLAQFGAPLAVWTIGSFILTFADRYYLNHYVGEAEVGLYSLAYKFSFLLSAFAVAPFQQVWEPRRFAIASDPQAEMIYSRMFLYLNVALAVGSIGIILFIRDALHLVVGPAFTSAHAVVPLLLATTIIQQWTGYCNFGLYFKNATHLYGWSAVIGVVAALGLNALLIPRYGMFGAAWATVLAYAIRFVPVYYFAQAQYRIRYPWAPVAGLCVVVLGVWAIRWYANILSLGPSIVFSVVSLLGVLWFIYAFLLDADGRAFIHTTLSRSRAMLRPRPL